ncbi:ABC transporter permease [Celeribacter halophilus]|nr:ABC transporter permease [Celeribacter halophilus]
MGRTSGNPLIRLTLQRMAISLGLLLAMSLLIFIGVELLPGDVAQNILGQSATPEALANLRTELGLDQPAPRRYLSWLWGILHGDLGTSLSGGQDIAEMISGRFANTMLLAGLAALVSVPTAIVLGLLAVLYRDSWVDRVISFSTLATISLPEYFIGYVLIMVFSIWLGVLPSDAIVYKGMGVGERLISLILPCVTLALVVIAHMMRMTRAALISVISSPYVETAELKGLKRRHILTRHVLPNAISPIITVVVLNLAYLIVGVVVVEVVFAYPGMGQLLVDHVAKRDVPVVQAVGLIFAATYIILNLIADILAIVANPRLRHPR